MFMLREMEITLDLSKDCVMFAVIDKKVIDHTTPESKMQGQKRTVMLMLREMEMITFTC